MSAIIVVDAFWGDSGKGKVAAFLAQKHQAAYSVRAGIGTNAGHSILFADGSYPATFSTPTPNCASAAASPLIPSCSSPNSTS